jgi:SEC-C motif
MSQIGRNVPCPCGSGLKYKRCCLRREVEVALDVARAERVWEQMQSWALPRFGDELGDSLKEHMDARGIGTEQRPATDDDLSLALCWLLIDRELTVGGGTPAKRYAELPEIAQSERVLATRIAQSGLGLHRVRDVAPGAWIELENVVSGARARVSSPNVSREATRWHVLLCRVMVGGPGPSLWGGAAFYEPSEEPELLAALEHIARARDLGTGPTALEEALRVGAAELLCFIPASRRAERVPYTLEGDTVSMAEASWRVRDHDSALEALFYAPELIAVGGTESGEGVSFDWITSRRELLARRPALPVGAICMESGPITAGGDGNVELEDVTSLGNFTLHGKRLTFFGISEARMDAAIALVELRLGDLVSRPTCRVRSIEEARSNPPVKHGSSSRYGRADARPGGEELSSIPQERFRELMYHRWIDDPNHHLGGLSPRMAAARGGYRNELESMLRSLEYHSARQRANHLPGPEVAWLRSELGLHMEPVTV